MNNNLQTDKFVDKVELIYKYDKKTPLFVRQADTELNHNNVEKALSIVLEGLKHYPHSPTPYFILGKCFTRLGKYADAEKAFRIGSEMIYSPETLQYYLTELDSIKKHKQPFEINKRTTFVEEEINSVQKQPPVQPRGVKLPNLEELAERISKAKISPPADTKPPADTSDENFEFKGAEIISETLAQIYESQSNYPEAIKMYKKLIRKFPEKTDEFTSKIQALSNKLTGT